MRNLFVCALFCLGALYSASPDYFSYLERLGWPNGESEKGEIEIIVDPVEIARIEEIQKERLIQRGFSEEIAQESSRVGIVKEDPYFIWLRDAVRFPNGFLGTYNRTMWRNQLFTNFPGVVVLPVLPSGKILLILNYRHAIRSWGLESPRGGVHVEETMEKAALRELKEETGFEASSLTFLGSVASDSGMLSAAVPTFLAHVAIQGDTAQEETEVIAGTFAFTKEEIQEGLVQGFVELDFEGRKEKIPLCDGFLTFAFLQAELRKLL